MALDAVFLRASERALALELPEREVQSVKALLVTLSTGGDDVDAEGGTAAS